ncbi:MAG: hypothetical protein QJT81_08415 [Candidatus Thiothrix putei]|uniref:Uncharacterized protein n=1 Tax=Candidatus Thiothrix putei TaxID=3080811 RepID=A0AA95HK64_9GAMM|nr:MAG: hypothetical protein QJT81_08415 [Candidatus Thiothrix putei]
MSEYQYYDFRAIDQSLTAAQKASVASLSSRAQVSSQRAEFVYHYGDFRGNVTQLMRGTFDVMLYIANWGNASLNVKAAQGIVWGRRRIRHSCSGSWGQAPCWALSVCWSGSG